MSILCSCVFFFFKQKTAYDMRISDWSSDVCSSDLFIAGVSAHLVEIMIDADDDDRVRAHIIGHLQRSIGDGDAGPKTLGGVALKRLAFAQIEIMDMIGLASHEPARLPRQIGGDGIDRKSTRLNSSH